MELSCRGCNKEFKKQSSSGYCGACFHANVDNVKSEYNKANWKSGRAKLSHWKNRGAILTDDDILHFNEQTNCEICGSDFDGNKCLDHCHETGKYRGALCRQCNASLGVLGDDIDVIIGRLMKYKVKWS